jgi:transposase-like protein
MISTSNILLLEKLIHLGKRLERTRIYELLEPWKFDGYDTIEVQKAGKKISDFIGLPNLTFIINYTKQGKNTAGHIELNNNSDESVFIEIDEKFKPENEIILAILAHEICHKLVHINGLTQYGYENEILTDAATVYTGLGKLSLNGCETKKVSTDTKWNGDERTTTTTTTTQTVGYLKRDQFAFLYNVVCKMRNIPNEYATKGLNSQALNAINGVIYNHDEELFHNDFILQQANDILESFNHQYHLVSAKSIKLIKTLQANFESVIETDKSIHKKIKTINEKYLIKATEDLNPKRLNYIKNLILFNELNYLGPLYENELRELTFLNNSIGNLLNKLNGKFQINLEIRDSLYNIKCPVCENNMRLRQNKLVKIKCTKCKYSFIVDNTKIESLNDSKRKKKSFIRKLKEMIAILKE